MLLEGSTVAATWQACTAKARGRLCQVQVTWQLASRLHSKGSSSALSSAGLQPPAGSGATQASQQLQQHAQVPLNALLSCTGSPQECAREAEQLVQQGFGALKLKVGGSRHCLQQVVRKRSVIAASLELWVVYTLWHCVLHCLLRPLPARAPRFCHSIIGPVHA